MSLLSEILQGIPLNAVLKEKVELIQRQYADLELENQRLRDQISALKIENKDLKCEISQLKSQEMRKPTIKWGCYKFEGEEGLFCVKCFETQKRKSPTSHVNSSTRRCLVCEAIIKN